MAAETDDVSEAGGPAAIARWALAPAAGVYGVVALGLGMLFAMLLKANEAPLSAALRIPEVEVGSLLAISVLLGIPMNGPGGALFLWLGLRMGRARGWLDRGRGAHHARCGLAGGLLNTALAAGPPLLMEPPGWLPQGLRVALELLAAFFMLPWVMLFYPLGLGIGVLAGLAGVDPSRLLTGLLFAFPGAGLAGGAVYGFLERRRTTGQ